MNISSIASTLSGPSRAAATVAPANDSVAKAAEEAAQRKKVAGQFEAILVRQMLNKSVGSMMGGDNVAGSVYGDMMTQVLADNLTAGPGLGLGRMLEKQLAPPSPHAAAAASHFSKSP
ncbi:MAG: rod-binding protein [Opitutaceae bacterium]